MLSGNMRLEDEGISGDAVMKDGERRRDTSHHTNFFRFLFILLARVVQYMYSRVFTV